MKQIPGSLREALRDLSGDDLKALHEQLVRVQDHLGDEGRDRAEAAAFALRYTLIEEADRRFRDEDNARVQLEAGGHEVYIGYDVVAEERRGIGWSPHCHCEAIDEGYMTRDEAIATAGAHAAEHGGQWAEGEPSTEEDHLPDGGEVGR